MHTTNTPDPSRASKTPTGSVANAAADTLIGATAPAKPVLETAMYGAGCFWGVESILQKQPGVKETTCGFAGGEKDNPTYKDVCDDDTGHAEVVLVKFDPAVISFEKLTDVFFRLHDPTQVNGQGPDLGDQYRSVIFFTTPEQQATAERVKQRRQDSGKYSKPIATAVEPAGKFFAADEHHQKYYEKNGKKPYCHVLRPE